MGLILLLGSFIGPIAILIWLAIRERRRNLAKGIPTLTDAVSIARFHMEKERGEYRYKKALQKYNAIKYTVKDEE